MIKLKSPLNYRGVIIEAGQIISYLPIEQQKKLVENGAAEFVNVNQSDDVEKKNEKPLEDMTKAELLEYAKTLQLEKVTDKMSKAEILEQIMKHLGGRDD